MIRLDAVAVSSSDMAKTVAFYELLGFMFPSWSADDKHVEHVAKPGEVRLMIDTAELMEQLTGHPPTRPTIPVSRCCVTARLRLMRSQRRFERQVIPSQLNRGMRFGASAMPPSKTLTDTRSTSSQSLPPPDPTELAGRHLCPKVQIWTACCPHRRQDLPIPPRPRQARQS